VRDLDGVPAILKLLAECGGNVKVQTRAVGAIHNMSSDADSIRLIRAKDGRGLHSSTFRLNLSALSGKGGAYRGCLGVFRRC